MSSEDRNGYRSQRKFIHENVRALGRDSHDMGSGVLQL